jgi:site-specific DNA-cytosine methylase
VGGFHGVHAPDDSLPYQVRVQEIKMASVNDITPGQRFIFKTFHLFAGIGGGSKGAGGARANWMGFTGLIENIGAIDVDPNACEDYRNLTGSNITCRDLFDRDQYRSFHGQEPPEGWREATAADIRAAAGGQCPDIVFTSPPCKGFSGLLPNASAETDKYQALNRLTVRSIRLTLEAFADAPPRILLLENVPRIKSRGRALLDEIKDLLRAHGYACHNADHDCGVIGGLGQRRKRYLLIARHKERCKPFVYQPPARPLKTIGDVIGPLPLPDDPSMGPMHRLPRLKWLTWLRLALIPAGGDWRDLQKIDSEEYRITWDPRGEGKGSGAYTVQDWDKTGATVTSSSRISGSSAGAVADPRLRQTGDNYSGSPGLYGVNEWGRPAPAVTGSASVSSSNCPAAIADPRVPENDSRHQSHYRVTDFNESAGTVTGSTHVANGAPCLADVRLPESKGVYPNRFRVVRWDVQAPVVTGDTDVQCGAPSISDPRLTGSGTRHNNKFRVSPNDEPAPCVTGTRFGSGALAFADPRLNHEPRPGNYGVLRMDETCGAVVGGQGVGVSNGPQAVADTRLDSNSRSGYMRVLGMNEVSPAVIGSARTTASNGPSVVADHRLGCSPREGTYGVMPWDDASQTVIGGMNVHACQAAIEDPRLRADMSAPTADSTIRIPGNNERLDPPPVIEALDGTWHRPLTTLELLALQSFPLKFADGRPVVLAGKSDSAWRERIGNAVPPEAAKHMFEQIALALLQNAVGETFTFGQTPIWVRPIVTQQNLRLAQFSSLLQAGENVSRLLNALFDKEDGDIPGQFNATNVFL